MEKLLKITPWGNMMRQLRNQYKVAWFEVRDENDMRIRRFESQEEAENFAEEYETIIRVTVTREAYVPQEAPF
jgi:hypothetical protein